MNCWKILEINPTDNVREIKRAYAAKSKVVHPEEHPEEFRELHEAYETALKLAKEGRVRVKRTASAPPVEGASEAEKGDDLFGNLDAEAGNAPEGGFVGVTEETPEVSKEDDESLFDSLKGQREPKIEPEVSPEEESALEDDLGFDEAMESAYEEYKEYLISTTQRILGKLEVLAYMLPDKSKDEWKKVIQTEEFVNVARAEFFIYHLTQFVKEHNDLSKDFYKALVETLNFKELSTREQKGMYTELYDICVSRGMYKEKSANGQSLAATIMVIIGVAAQSLLRSVRILDVESDVIKYVLAAIILIIFLVLVVRTVLNPSVRENIKENLKERWKNFLGIRRFVNPMYVIRNRVRPTITHYLYVFIIFVFSVGMIMVLEAWWLLAIFLLLMGLSMVAFVYMVIMHIIVGILCMKDRKKK